MAVAGVAASQVKFQAEKICSYKPPSPARSTGSYKLTCLAPKSFNLQVMGAMGTGKSSLINAMFTALNFEDGVQEILTVLCRPSTSVTPEFIRLALTRAIRIGDIWGWSLENYAAREFDYLLQGRLKHLALEDKISQNIDRNIIGPVPTADNPSPWDWNERVHCVLFTIPAKSYDDANYIKRLATFRAIADRADINVPYLVVITQIDEAIPELRNKPELIATDERVLAIIQAVAKNPLIGINSSNVLPSMAYVPELTHNVHIDLLAQNIILRAIQRFEQWLFKQDQRASTYTKQPVVLDADRIVSGH